VEESNGTEVGALDEGPHVRDDLAREVNRLLAERGVEFGEGEENALRVDPVPRLLDEGEWAVLAAGVRQRVLALEAFLDDAYGDQQLIADGIVPERIVAGSGFFERDLVGRPPSGGARISVAGLDIVRDDSGQFRVLEDNARNPSGIAYAVAVSEAVAEVLGVDQPPTDMGKAAPASLRRCLEASAPGVDGVLVLLTEGPDNSAYYEHRRIAAAADLELVELDGLRRDGDRVRLGDGRRVRSVYRRTGQDRVRDDDGELTAEAEILLEPLLSGNLGMANWYGTGVADDKSVYAYVDDLIRQVLGEEPLVPSVPTYDLLDAERLREVLDRIGELVVKPRDGYGGKDVVVGPAASREELDAARAAIEEDPDGWIAQEPVTLSTHPTVIHGDFEPRHVDLRPFAFHDGSDVVVPTGGLTRVAMQEGEVIVNSSRDGGGKATWVV